MNAQTEKHNFTGPAGVLQGLIDKPSSAVPKGVALVAHPHPLFGGTMDNKVVLTLARALVQAGWVAVRFNFRGVGSSQGVHDNGQGEVQDMASVLAAVAPQGPIALAGFSFGAYVTVALVNHLAAQQRLTDLQKLVLVGTAASRFVVPPLPDQCHRATLVLHGEADDTVPLSSVMDWARPQILPVTVVPGGGHFFHGQLPLLKSLVQAHLAVPTGLKSFLCS